MSGKLSAYKKYQPGGSGQAVDTNALGYGGSSVSQAGQQQDAGGFLSRSIIPAVGNVVGSAAQQATQAAQPSQQQQQFNAQQRVTASDLSKIYQTAHQQPPTQQQQQQVPADTSGQQLDIVAANTPAYQVSPMPGVSDVTQTQAATYAAQEANVPEEWTVAGRMSKILGEDSPYIQAARTQGIQTAAGRGLSQSSIAVGAAELAAIQAALPIAQQDSQQYMQTALANQDAYNQAMAQNAQLGTEVNLANMDAQNQMVAAQAELAMSEQLAQQQSIITMGQTAAAAALQERSMMVDELIRTRLAGVEQGYALELETLKQEYEIERNLTSQAASIYDGALRSISNVLQNENLTTEQSTNAVRVIIDNMTAGLAFLQGVSGGTGGAGAEAMGALAAGSLAPGYYYPGEQPPAAGGGAGGGGGAAVPAANAAPITINPPAPATAGGTQPFKGNVAEAITGAGYTAGVGGASPGILGGGMSYAPGALEAAGYIPTYNPNTYTPPALPAGMSYA